LCIIIMILFWFIILFITRIVFAWTKIILTNVVISWQNLNVLILQIKNNLNLWKTNYFCAEVVDENNALKNQMSLLCILQQTMFAYFSAFDGKCFLHIGKVPCRPLIHLLTCCSDVWTWIILFDTGPTRIPCTWAFLGKPWSTTILQLPVCSLIYGMKHAIPAPSLKLPGKFNGRRKLFHQAHSEICHWLLYHRIIQKTWILYNSIIWAFW